MFLLNILFRINFILILSAVEVFGQRILSYNINNFTKPRIRNFRDIFDIMILRYEYIILLIKFIVNNNISL